jgi:hypothetical protein
MSCFSLIFFSFLFCNIGEQADRTGPALEGGLAAVGGGRWWEKG